MPYRVDCWNCGGEGVIDGDCTCQEDRCVCLEPEAPPCSHCRGKGFMIVTDLTDDNCQDAVLIR